MARYIDAEKMREDWLENGENEFVYDTNAVLDSIDAQPTADVVEVKHGEWVDKWEGKYANPTYVCSNCGEKALLECYINELSQWRYRQSLSMRCPHCGAKMDVSILEITTEGGKAR